MGLKDGVFSWFIQNVIAPSIEIIDKPGFVITSFSEKGKETYLRELFLEDELIKNIENKIIEKYGDRGKQVLYSAGKKFGYIYSSMSNFPQLNSTNFKEIEETSQFLVRFVSVLYAKDAQSKIDIASKSFEAEFEKYVVCSENGNGFILTSGGVAGIWSFVMNDKTVEGIQKTCQGRGDKKCKVISKPSKLFQDDELFFKEQNLVDLKYPLQYKKMNVARKTQFAKNSLKNLIDSRFFTYFEGSLCYKDIRYFYCAADIIYILEEEIRKLDGGEDTLFDACFEFGKSLQKNSGSKDYSKFINDYFSATGWGDIIVSSKKPFEVVSNYYPWTTFSESAKYVIFRGVISGFISGCTDTNIKFKKAASFVTDSLMVKIYEN